MLLAIAVVVTVAVVAIVALAIDAGSEVLTVWGGRDDKEDLEEGKQTMMTVMMIMTAASLSPSSVILEPHRPPSW